MNVPRASWAEIAVGWVAASGVSKVTLALLDGFIAYGLPIASFVLVSWWTVEKALSERERRAAYKRVGHHVPVARLFTGKGRSRVSAVDEFDDTPAPTPPK